jgi:hypothetical protein
MNGTSSNRLAAKMAVSLAFLFCAFFIWSDDIGDRVSNGNLIVSGSGDLPGVGPLSFSVPGKPLRLAATATGQSSLWIVTQADGQRLSFQVDGRGVTEVTTAPRVLLQDAHPLTTPVTMPKSRKTAYIATNGDLVVLDGSRLTRLPIGALPDARILADTSDRILVLTDPTDRYGHGILGDRIEAAGVALIETQPVPRMVQKIKIRTPEVVEGLAPIWVDLDDDGIKEIIVTTSDRREGARLTVFDEQGRRVASSPAIGTGYRWRHQLAVGPFGPNGEVEIADLLTPHIGGVVEFFRLDGDRLIKKASIRGYSTHVIGSRNLETALAGDFAGDGRLELLVPKQDFRRLSAIRRTSDGAAVIWESEVGEPITTNLAAATLSNGNIVFGLGRADGTIQIWPAVEKPAR